MNDPIYGFISIPSALLFDIMEHPYFQRLRRITQMGLSYLVYPGAHHTRFHHAMGCLHLMQKSVSVLRFKGIKISAIEEEALYIGILLHDIGHGPFSHAMEHSIVHGITHEQISLLFMQQLNDFFAGRLSLAIQIFKGEYFRPFMHQLISSQLDMDRMDYLRRDSFYTGVAEGNINSERLISMLHVVDDQLVVEEKGIYSAEKFLLARRLMYWQVYLHKTSIVAENVLIKILKRAKELVGKGIQLEVHGPLDFFLQNKIDRFNFSEEILSKFSILDDCDIVFALKKWTNSPDKVLSYLCKMIINRDLLKIKIKKKPIDSTKFEEALQEVMASKSWTRHEASYLVFKGSIANQAYHQNKQNINILYKNKKIIDITKASDHLNIKALSIPVTKYFLCYPKRSIAVEAE